MRFGRGRAKSRPCHTFKNAPKSGGCAASMVWSTKAQRCTTMTASVIRLQSSKAKSAKYQCSRRELLLSRRFARWGNHCRVGGQRVTDYSIGTLPTAPLRTGRDSFDVIRLSGKPYSDTHHRMSPYGSLGDSICILPVFYAVRLSSCLPIQVVAHVPDSGLSSLLVYEYDVLPLPLRTRRVHIVGLVDD